jgi:hypothetical protein
MLAKHSFVWFWSSHGFSKVRAAPGDEAKAASSSHGRGKGQAARGGSGFAALSSVPAKMISASLPGWQIRLRALTFVKAAESPFEKRWRTSHLH